MRTVAAELTIFGGKAFIIFIFICSILSVFDLDIKKIGFNGQNVLAEFSKRIDEEKSNSIAEDIKSGNIETPSDKTLNLSALQNKIDSYILENIINELQLNESKIEEGTTQLGLPQNNILAIPEKSTIDGYIFIGNFDNNEWDKTMFAEKVKSPGDIRKGEILTLTSNLYLRAEMPTNSEEYYRNIKSIKILPKGTKVTILGKPVGIKRQHATQWWVHVSY